MTTTSNQQTSFEKDVEVYDVKMDKPLGLENFGYIKQDIPKMKDFIKPTKQYSEEVKEISRKIELKTSEISRELEAFKQAFGDVAGKQEDGMSMNQIKDSYVREKEQAEMDEIGDEILDLFSKKLKSLKQQIASE